MKSSNQSKKLIVSEDLKIETNVAIPSKPTRNAQEYMDARTIHDRFCKFEIPYNAGESIKTIRLITQTYRLEVLKVADLPFKLNSLRWFLTPKGKIFLKNQEREFEIQKKRNALDISNIIMG